MENSIKIKRKLEERKKKIFICGLGLLLVIAVMISLSLGSFSISESQVVKIFFSKIITVEHTWTDQTQNILLSIRFPRILGAVIVGSALAISGTTYQGIFKNPLISPDLLGVSAGACVGASLGILLHFSVFFIQIMALLIGLCSVALTCIIPKLFHNHSNLMLVLSGVVVSGIMNSIQGFTKYIADTDEELPSIVYWTMGSLASVRMREVCMIVIPFILASSVLIILRWRINLLMLGENEVQTLGVNVKLIKIISILCSTVLTACAVCISGTIGWVGLVIPHVGRILVGQDNRHLLPLSLLLGSLFLTIIDTLARNITVSEVPLSIFTGIIGGPLFIIILAKQGMKKN